uniref:Uncharacterized protein n=1 Tax=Onchocerca volvulus TaxID=6282 RepID=A0A8R1TMK5_ONCVO
MQRMVEIKEIMISLLLRFLLTFTSHFRIPNAFIQTFMIGNVQLQGFRVLADRTAAPEITMKSLNKTYLISRTDISQEKVNEIAMANIKIEAGPSK